MEAGLDSSSFVLYNVSMLNSEALEFFRACGSRGGKLGGHKGGSAHVRKGFSCMSPERFREIVAKSIATRKARKNSKNS